MHLQLKMKICCLCSNIRTFFNFSFSLLYKKKTIFAALENMKIFHVTFILCRKVLFCIFFSSLTKTKSFSLFFNDKWSALFFGQYIEQVVFKPWVARKHFFLPHLQFPFPIILKIIHVPLKLKKKKMNFLMQDVRRKASRLLIHANYILPPNLSILLLYYKLLSFNYSPSYCIFSWISFTFSPYFKKKLFFAIFSANINKEICPSKNIVKLKENATISTPNPSSNVHAFALYYLPSNCASCAPCSLVENKKETKIERKGLWE